MDEDLLGQFFDEECSAYARDLILGWIAEARSTAVAGRKTFEFNRFEVSVDLEHDRVVVEDVLEAASSTETPIREFEARLRAVPSTK
ncbi:MAG: hypothetical protein ACE37F_31630 [Nannocystaceae bacterium]|nr:hypothetical protein [bacterium]